MENDLISRQKLIDDLEAWRKLLDRRVSRFDDMVIHTLPVVFDLVNEQKTVAAEPVRHEGTTTYITTNDLDKYQDRIVVDEGEKSKFCQVYYADNPGWDVFDDISSSYYGKQVYFTQPDGTIYSRLSCGYMTFEEALSEFREAISMDGGEEG